ncbi:hypothetical protein DFH27DRAFT_522264 [Peziza echinospora]|nr:hypothetical protein DFH27DRAFT_522264 [Peziza echinospora]
MSTRNPRALEKKLMQPRTGTTYVYVDEENETIYFHGGGGTRALNEGHPEEGNFGYSSSIKRPLSGLGNLYEENTLRGAGTTGHEKEALLLSRYILERPLYQGILVAHDHMHGEFKFWGPGPEGKIFYVYHAYGQVEICRYVLVPVLARTDLCRGCLVIGREGEPLGNLCGLDGGVGLGRVELWGEMREMGSAIEPVSNQSICKSTHVPGSIQKHTKQVLAATGWLGQRIHASRPTGRICKCATADYMCKQSKFKLKRKLNLQYERHDAGGDMGGKK